MLHREHVSIEIGYPLLAFLCDPEITQCISDIRPHLLPEEIWVIVSKIRNAHVSQFFARPSFSELIEQGGLLSKIVDVGKLSDQIGRAHKSWRIICRFMRFIFGHRETRVLDVFFNLGNIELDNRIVETLADEKL